MVTQSKLGRVYDLALIKRVRKLPCAICGEEGGNEAHHLQTRGSGGGDTIDNLVSLCRRHHQRIHAMGVKSFCEAFQLPVTFDTGYPRLILDE